MSPAVVTLLEVVVIVGVVCFFLFLIGRYIYRKKKGLPTGDCAMCHKSSKKLLKEYHKCCQSQNKLGCPR